MTHTIFLVDDDPMMIRVMGKLLGELGQLRFATSGSAALLQMRTHAPDLVLLDADMPDMDGYEVCAAMQDDPDLATIPVIFVTGHDEQAFEIKGFEAGAVDYISKPISEPLLMARVRTQLKIKRLTDELRNLATIDALTETLNRRSFDKALEREYRRALRSHCPISLLMIDVDHFKGYNDLYGHPAGDACLRQIAITLRTTSHRPGDLVARYGGEEFVMLLPQTTSDGAQYLAHLVLTAVDNLKIPHESSPVTDHVTISVGVATLQASDDSEKIVGLSPDTEQPLPVSSATDLLYVADLALYRAKRAGRARAYTLDTEPGMLGPNRHIKSSRGFVMTVRFDASNDIHDFGSNFFYPANASD